MSGMTPFRIHLAGVDFHFENKGQLVEWMGTNVAHAVDRRLLYEAVVCDSSNMVLHLTENKTDQNEADSLSILRSLKVISDTFGKLYDPSTEIFSLEEDSSKKLDIT